MRTALDVAPTTGMAPVLSALGLSLAAGGAERPTSASSAGLATGREGASSSA